MKAILPNRYLRSGKKRPPNTRKGFTLVELLVVIAIIAVLAILSFFGASKMRSKARGVTCSSNLRQIGTAMLAYASDNSGQLPPLEDRTGADDGLRGIWPAIVADGGYLARVPNKNNELSAGAGVWACPECSVVHKNYNGYGAAEGTILKVKRGSLPGSGSLRIAQINSPENTWLVGDAVKTASDLKSGWYAIWSNPSAWAGQSPGPRHGGKVNVCMVDGAVRQMTLQELKDKKTTLNN
jgi:prepilin-type N-terminal cleavage/methylation domain-containing protein/prepilin-type processing-associated H-X9-DG protein